MGCAVSDRLFFLTRGQVLAHLQEHRSLGDKVPNAAFSRLRREMKESMSRHFFPEAK